MASRTERQRILSGSLNLLPPSDKIPDGDALLLDNWRVDQAGELRSRKPAKLEAGPIGSGVFHTLARAADDRYAGIGSSLYHGLGLDTSIASGFDGNPLGFAFYQGAAWVMNRLKALRVKGAATSNWGIAAPATAPTATPGEKIESDLCSFTGTLDQAGYYDASSVFQSRTDTPSVQNNVNPTGDPTFGVVPALVTADVAAKWTLYQRLTSAGGSGVDTRTLGIAQDHDLLQVVFWAEQPELIESITITLLSNEIALAGSVIPSVEITLPGSALNQAPQSWSGLTVNRAVNMDPDLPKLSTDVPNFFVDDPAAVEDWINDLRSYHFMEYEGLAIQYTGGGPVFTPTLNGSEPTFSSGMRRVTGFDLFDWSNVTSIRVSVTITQPCRFGLGQFRVFGNVPGSLSGSITYYVSFANADGEDSDPSPPVSVDVDNQSVALNNIPISPDPQVTERRIYRIGDTPQSLLVGKIPDNVFTGPFFDQTSTTQAQNDDTLMPVNRTYPAPAARALIGPYLGRLIAFRSDAYPARYWWTPVGQPWFFPGNDDPDIGNWEDAGGDDEALVGATFRTRLINFYKERSIWRLSGDPESADPERTSAKIGLVGPKAVVNGGSVDYLVGPEGVYLFNGDFEQDISGAIKPIFMGDVVQISAGEFIQPIERSLMSQCVLEIINDRLHFSYAEVGSASPNVTLICHLPGAVAITSVPTYSWTRMKLNGQASAFTALHYEGAGKYLMGGVTSGAGYLYSLERNVGDGTESVQVAWQSRFVDQGLPDLYKVYTELEIDFQTGVASEVAGAVLVYLVLEDGTKVFIRTLGSAVRTTVHLSLESIAPLDEGYGLRGKRVAVRIEGSLTSTAIIYGAYLHWYPEERLARTFDSGLTDFGLPERVKQVDFVETYMTATGQTLNRQLWSDLPGGVLTQRLVEGFASPNGTGTVRSRLGSIVEGRNFRLTLGAAGAEFQVRNIRARMRPIGEYIDGTIQEYWESPEFSVAPGRDGELKDLLLDYDSSAAGGWLVVYADSDPPGTSLTASRVIPIPAGTRRTFVFPFDDPLYALDSSPLPYGTIFKIRVVPPVGGIIRLHGRASLRARIIGVSFDGSAGERWETQALDMVSGIGLFREIAAIAQTTGPMTLEMLTRMSDDEPWVSRVQQTINTPVNASTRSPINFRLPGETKGRLQMFRLTGIYQARLFQLRIFGRGLGNVNTPWSWLSVPIEETPEEFAQIELPVRQTPEAFSWVDLPVDAIE